MGGTPSHKLFILMGILLFNALFLFAQERLVLISPHWEGYKTETEQAFKRWHKEKYGTDVVLDWRDVGGSSDILKFVQSEFKQRPKGIGIDLFFGGGVDPFVKLKELEMLETYQPSEEIMSRIPATINGIPMYDPQYTWFGTAISGFGILCNKKVAGIMQLPEVHTWEDMTDPRLFSWIASADPRGSGSAAALYEIILQAYGWEKGWRMIAEISGNIRSFNKNASMAAKEVTFGDAAYGLAIDVYGLNQVSTAGAENMSFIYPAGVTIINPDAIAIIKGAPNDHIAKRFVDFMLSPEGQKLWVHPKGSPGGPQKFDIPRMSILPELYDAYPPGRGFINPFESPMKLQYNSKLATARREVVQGIIGATIIDLHQEVTAAWKKINSLNISEAEKTRLRDEFSRPPVTEQEAAQLAETDWKDAVKRNKLLHEWQVWAVKKYRSF